MRYETKNIVLFSYVLMGTKCALFSAIFSLCFGVRIFAMIMSAVSILKVPVSYAHTVKVRMIEISVFSHA